MNPEQEAPGHEEAAAVEYRKRRLRTLAAPIESPRARSPLLRETRATATAHWESHVAHDATECRCPLCKSLLSRKVYEEVLRINEVRDQELARGREAIKEKLSELERDRERIAKRAADAERKKVTAEASKARTRLLGQIKQVQAIAARDVKRLTSQVAQIRKTADAERRRAEREAAERIRAAERAAAEPHLRQVAKLNEQLAMAEERRHREVESLNRAVADLKQRTEAHDRAHFGPEGEEHLVVALKEAFPSDNIVHRGKGGDVIHTVVDAGQPFGKIVYECKKTSTWQVAYTRQLKKAMEGHETKYGLLVSRKLPRNGSGVCTSNRILVVEPHLAVQVASILREAIIALGRARVSDHGRAAKTDEVYKYLCSDEFANALARIDDKVGELRAALEKEKSSHDGWWRSREQHYGTILREASGIDARVKEILSGSPSRAAAPVRRIHG